MIAVEGVAAAGIVGVQGAPVNNGPTDETKRSKATPTAGQSRGAKKGIKITGLFSSTD